MNEALDHLKNVVEKFPNQEHGAHVIFYQEEKCLTVWDQSSLLWVCWENDPETFVKMCQRFPLKLNSSYLFMYLFLFAKFY